MITDNENLILFYDIKYTNSKLIKIIPEEILELKNRLPKFFNNKNIEDGTYSVLLNKIVKKL